MADLAADLAWAFDGLTLAVLERDEREKWERLADVVADDLANNPDWHEGCVPEADVDTAKTDRAYDAGFADLQHRVVAGIEKLRAAGKLTDEAAQTIASRVAVMEPDPDPAEEPAAAPPPFVPVAVR